MIPARTSYEPAPPQAPPCTPEHPVGAETPGPELGPLIVGCLAGATVLYGPFALEWLAYFLTGGGAS